MLIEHILVVLFLKSSTLATLVDVLLVVVTSHLQENGTHSLSSTEIQLELKFVVEPSFFPVI